MNIDHTTTGSGTARDKVSAHIDDMINGTRFTRADLRKNFPRIQRNTIAGIVFWLRKEGAIKQSERGVYEKL